MLIPHDQLEVDTLTRLIEDFVTREGTDNGDETPLETLSLIHISEPTRPY